MAEKAATAAVSAVGAADTLCQGSEVDGNVSNLCIRYEEEQKTILWRGKSIGMEIATAVGTSMAEKVATAAVDGLWQQICYILDHNDNVKELRSKLQALKDARERVLHQVEDATKRLQEQIENDVLTWMRDVDEEISKAEKILEENDVARRSCCVGLLPNVKNRYKFSKSEKLEAPIVENLAGGGKFDKVGYRVPVQTMAPVKGYEAFESRITIFGSILKALKDENVNMVGVWGLGGVGKTTLAKKIAEQVKADGIFQSVVIIHVGQNPDLKKIQSEFAEWLGLKFEAESFEIRASLLHDRVNQEKSILLILDDVWKNIELADAGIMTGGGKSAYKILVTTRNEKVLHQMDTQSCLRLDALTDAEAWELFDKTVGAVEDLEMQQVAAEIVTRCAGLPILILPVAAALKQRELYEWKDALETLKTFDNQDINAKAYAALELSYNSLEEEARFLFLLCTQFARGNIDIRFLLPHCMGWGLFVQCRTLEGTRNRLLKVINGIKSASLLLEGESSDVFFMHDVVYSFAFSKLSKNDESLILSCHSQLEEWPAPNSLQNYTSIFLPFCDIPDLPAEPKCPNLISFSLWNYDSPFKIPNNFFLTMKELRVFHLTDMNLSPLPSSLQSLSSLQTLYLTRCILRDISMMGELKNLQALCLEHSKITHFPKEMAKLTHLQLLDLRESGEIKVIPPKVLSCLTQLEELYMGDSFTGWGLKDEDGQTLNADLAELKCLKKLNTLDIMFTDLEILPDNLFSNKLERFFIIIGDGWRWNRSRKRGISRTLKLKLNASIQAMGKVSVLLKRTEYLYLDSIGGTDVDILQLDWEGFCHLKNLKLQNCDQLRYIVNSVGRRPCTVFPRLEALVVESSPHFEQICSGPLKKESFNKLKKIKIKSCDGLRTLFPFPFAKFLLRLEEIEVAYCEKIEVIFVADDINDDEDGGNGEIIEQKDAKSISRINHLHLDTLPALKHIWNPQSQLHFVLQDLKSLTVWSCKSLTDLAPPSASFENLTTLSVGHCENLASLLTFSTAASLKQLREMEVHSCNMLVEIVSAANESEIEQISFDKLESLKLIDLECVRSFCSKNYTLEFPLLIELVVKDCSRMEFFSPGHLSTPKLKSVKLGRYQATSYWKADLNSTIRQLHTEMSQVPQDSIVGDD